MASFAEQFKAAAKRIADRADRVAEQVVVGVGESLVDKSPVGDWASWSAASQAARPMPPYVPGQFKGSWHHSFNSPSDDFTSTVDATGDSSMREIRAGAAQESVSKHYITNNVGYAMLMERGWAHGTQPGGIVALTEIEFPQIVREANRRVV